MSVNKWTVYLKPFLEDGTRGDFIDVTDDVDLNSLSKIAIDLDNTEYDIGVYRNSSLSLAFKNRDGRYSDVDNSKSVFRYKRADSLVRVTWRFGRPPLCGIATASGEWYLGEEITVFEGLLSDDNLKMNLSDQTIKFSVIGRESLFSRVTVPFGSISNGDLLSEVLYALLNQAAITDLLTVSLSNLLPDLDQEIDSIASLQNKTVQEGLNKILLAGNSVLYIDGDTVRVKAREESASLMRTFFGAGAYRGQENVIDIQEIKTGVSRIVNYSVWKDVNLTRENASSQTKYGVRKKELDFEFFTDNTKRGNILQSIVDEFGDPKEELRLIARLTYDTIALQLLDKVTIDYPLVSIDQEGEIFGAAIAGVSKAAKVLNQFERLPSQFYKIMGRSINVAAATIEFKLRGV